MALSVLCRLLLRRVRRVRLPRVMRMAVSLVLSSHVWRSGSQRASSRQSWMTRRR
jgi:hypothetical protein